MPLRIEIKSHSEKETRVLGYKTGKLLKPGNVVALTGGLGSGKTVFVQGVAEGLDVPKNYYVTSPTYTLINEYPGRYPLFHVDLYRISNFYDFEDIGLYEILSGKNGVVAIEWADKLDTDILSEHVTIRFDFDILSDKLRKIDIAAHGPEGIDLIKKL